MFFLTYRSRLTFASITQLYFHSRIEVADLGNSSKSITASVVTKHNNDNDPSSWPFYRASNVVGGFCGASKGNGPPVCLESKEHSPSGDGGLSTTRCKMEGNACCCFQHIKTISSLCCKKKHFLWQLGRGWWHTFPSLLRLVALGIVSH